MPLLQASESQDPSACAGAAKAPRALLDRRGVAALPDLERTDVVLGKEAPDVLAVHRAGAQHPPGLEERRARSLLAPDPGQLGGEGAGALLGTERPEQAAPHEARIRIREPGDARRLFGAPGRDVLGLRDERMALALS